MEPAQRPGITEAIEVVNVSYDLMLSEVDRDPEEQSILKIYNRVKRISPNIQWRLLMTFSSSF